MRTSIVLLAAVLAGTPALLTNGSFEEYALLEGRPHADRGKGIWKLHRSRMPAGWYLNEAYPGRLAVEDEGGARGSRYVTISATGSLDAQIHQPLPAVAPGHWFRISAQIRGGAGTLLVYEYPEGKAAPVARTLAAGSAPAGAWRRITGFYTPPEKGFGSASVAILVPKSRTVSVDDVRVERLDTVPPPEASAPLALQNSEVKLLLSKRGRVLSLREKASGRELAEPSSTLTFLTAVRGGVRYPVNSVSKSGRDLLVTFVDKAISVRLTVTKRKRFFVFEVRRAAPDDLESLELAFPVAPLGTTGSATNGTWDDRTGLCHMAVSPNTESRLVPRGRAVCPTAVWHRRHGFEGGRSALVATTFPRFLETIEEMEEYTGLPSPKLPERWGAAGESPRSWARRSGAVGRSYLFVTGYAPGDLDDLIGAAKLGGFDLILFLDAIWKKSGGHYAVREDNFPGGLSGLREAGDRIHAAGLGFGLHFIGATVSANDAYVTPVPDPRLFGMKCPPLAEAVDAEATTITLEGPVPHAALLARPASRFPGHWLQLRKELVTFDRLEPGPPARFVGVVRGALGSAAASHRRGTRVRSLASAYGCFLVDADSDLVPELSRSLAGLVNGASVDMVYFDAIGTIDPASGVDTWYYLNRLLPPLCAGFERDVLVQTGTGLGRQLLWHLVPRSASADGHGDLKGYLDRRLPQIRAIRKDFSAADVGWYALDLATERDELEYVAGRCLALSASISVQANRHILTRHPRAREIFEMLERYERCRLSGALPEAERKRLLEPGRDFRLLEAGRGEWRLFTAAHSPVRPVTARSGEADVVEIVNDRPSPVRLEVEVHRERQVATPADYASPSALVLAGFADLSLYDAGPANRYGDHVTGPERVLTRGGLARADVTASLAPGPEKGSVVLSARNAGRGGGWCARGRRFDPPIDLSATGAFAVGVHGDGNGEVLRIRLVDRAGARRDWNIPVGFRGRRLRTYARPQAAGFDWKAVEYMVVELLGIPRETRVEVRLEPVKALRAARRTGPVHGLSITVDGKRYPISGELSPGQTVTLDALGRGTRWPGGMAPGIPLRITEGPISVGPGSHRVGLALEGGEDHEDLLLRVTRLWE